MHPEGQGRDHEIGKSNQFQKLDALTNHKRNLPPILDFKHQFNNVPDTSCSAF